MPKTGLNFQLPVLRILENEHNYLSHVMKEWHTIALGFERNEYDYESGQQALQTIINKITAFKSALNKHLEKEEAYLFPSLAHYVGTEQGPVIAVEEEHEEMNAYIDHFLHHAKSESISKFTLEQMEALVQDALEAFEIITIHFIKEESIVFPMVESVLNKEEQEELFNQLYTPIVGLTELLN